MVEAVVTVAAVVVVVVVVAVVVVVVVVVVVFVVVVVGVQCTQFNCKRRAPAYFTYLRPRDPTYRRRQ